MTKVKKTRKVRSDKGIRRKPETKVARVPVAFLGKVKAYIKKLVNDIENS